MRYWKILNKSKEEAEILLYEQIGKDYWSDSGITAKQFAEDLKGLEGVKRLNIRINSPGGAVFDGLAIYNLLNAHTAEKIVHIDGVAASIASAIACAGDKIIMPENAFMMIHEPHALVMGDAEMMKKMADTLEKTAESLISIYQAKCGRDKDKIKKAMKAETWFTAAEAMEFGFCDEIVEAVKMAASVDLGAFANVPEALRGGINREAVEGKAEISGGSCQDAQAKGGEVYCENKDNIKVEIGQKNSNKGGKDMEDIRKTRDSEIAEILAIAEKHEMMPFAKKCIAEGKSKAEFVEELLKEKYNAKPVATDAKIGMSLKEIRQYSLVKAIRGSFMEKEYKVPFEGLEKEASDAVGKLIGKQASGFFIPEDIMSFNPQAAMQTTDATKGGYTVGTEILVNEIVELLRNKTLMLRLGARQLSGLVGNAAIPKISGGATAYWLPETGEVTPTDQAFNQIVLTPHRLVGDTAYTKELLMQSSISVEAFIRDDLMRVLAVALDLAAVAGDGSAGQPIGILSTTGIGSVTFGGAATWGKVVEFETQVAEANADFGSLAYVTTPTTRGKWKTITKIASSQYSDFLWGKGDGEFGEVNGYRAGATKQVPNNRVIFGNFNDLIIATWAGIDVVVDPYSLKRTGQIEITLTQWADIAVRRAGSFCASTDSGAQ